MLAKISNATGQKFIIIIDEWDALFREAKDDEKLQKEYIMLLRGLFKSNQTDKMIEAAYMTGILPIKKYGTQSAITAVRSISAVSGQVHSRLRSWRQGNFLAHVSCGWIWIPPG